MSRDNLRLQGKTYHARMIIPADVRDQFPGRNGKPQTAFMRSTECQDRPKAAKKAQEFLVLWRRQIDMARNGEDAHAFAQRWMKTFENTPVDNESASAMTEAMDMDIDRAVRKGDIKLEEVPMVRNVAQKKSTSLSSHRDGFMDTYRNHAIGTQSVYSASISQFLSEFSTPEEVTNLALKAWVRKLADEKNLKASTVTRAKNVAALFWDYLIDTGVLVTDTNPFTVSKVRTPRTAGKAVSYLPYSVKEVNQLMADAVSKDDEALILLIELGRWTGARIEELCKLKKTDVHLKEGWFAITDSKTVAGVREVPIHPSLLPILADAIKKSQCEYVIDDLSIGKKHGDRSRAIGKRFGRLKAKYWTTRAYCFHSFRKTVVTLLERAGVVEGITADIVGHEKDTVTYGLYSGGTSMEQKKEAIIKLAY